MNTATRPDALTYAEAARIVREHVIDKSYQAYPIGQEVAGYLRGARKRFTDSTYRDYEGGLDKLARFFPDLELADLEPPIGTIRIESFLEAQWGDAKPRTYNKNHTVINEFFKWCCKRGLLVGNPAANIDRAKAAGVYRTTFTLDQRRAILAENEGLRDRIALRLLLDYGIRKGSLQAVRFQHFDHARKRLTIFAKGGKVRNVPLPDPGFWNDLGRLIIETEATGQHFLMPRRKGNGAKMIEIPTEPMGVNGMHRWWYRCLVAAGVVPEGTTKGERMHKARHTAGQRLLDHTGNLKAVQQLLGHSSITTTGDIYVGWDEDQLAASLESALRREEAE